MKRKKEQDSPDREVGSLQSSRSRNPLGFVNQINQDTIPTKSNKVCDGNGCSREATKEKEVNVGELGIIKLNLCENCIPKFTVQYEKNRIVKRE